LRTGKCDRHRGLPVGKYVFMAVPSNRGRSPNQDQPVRRLLNRAEAVTLLGMLLCIVSLFLAWPLPVIGKLITPAMYMNLNRTVRGADMPEVHWPVMIGAIACGLLLAFTPSPNSRIQIAFVQALCGLVCLIVGFMHFAMQPGPIVDVIGGALLTFGAVDRLSQRPTAAS